MSENERFASLEGYPSQITFPVAWGEMDAFGHVNNVIYFRYFESGRLDYFARTGVVGQMKAVGEGPILAHTECRFRMPLNWPDQVTVGTRVETIGADRFTMHYRVVSHKTRQIAAEGTGRVVWFDYRGKAGKRPLPSKIVEAMRHFDPSIEEGDQ